jgi:hypothetical protein
MNLGRRHRIQMRVSWEASACVKIPSLSVYEKTTHDVGMLVRARNECEAMRVEVLAALLRPSGQTKLLHNACNIRKCCNICNICNVTVT